MSKRKYRKWTDQDLIRAVASSISLAEVMRKIGICEAGGNYHNIKKNIDRLKLNISHLRGQGWNRDTYHNIGELSSPSAIKRNLINQRGHQCESCHLTSWLNQSIKLELHHIDGNRSNNSEKNLTILCPNCHAYTDNFRGKKLKASGPLCS